MPSLEPTRKRVSELAVGDIALCRTSFTRTSRQYPHYMTDTVTKITAKFVVIGTIQFSRMTGLPRYQRDRGKLIDGNDENIAAWRAYRAAIEENQRKREEAIAQQRQEDQRKARSACAWLAKTPPDAIMAQMPLCELTELYDRLKQQNLVA